MSNVRKVHIMHWSLKQIKAHAGTDITSYSFDAIEDLRRRADLEKIAYSYGVYGLNGYLFIDNKTGDFYKITSRSTALMQLY